MGSDLGLSLAPKPSIRGEAATIANANLLEPVLSFLTIEGKSTNLFTMLDRSSSELYIKTHDIITTLAISRASGSETDWKNEGSPADGEET
jgi:hypothetical protein